MGSSRTTALARRKRKRKRRRPQAKALLAPVAALRTPSRGRGAGRTLAAVPRPSWKLLGLAGIAGVAATGVVVARNRRAQRELPPDELRERLHERLAKIDAEQPPTAPPA